MESKNFTKVFGTLDMPSVVMCGLKSLDVESIKLFKKEGLLSVDLSGRRIVNEENLEVFKRSLYKNFKFIKKAEISVKYDTDEELSQILKKYIKNILTAVKEKNRFCYFALFDSDYEVQDKKILFKLKRRGNYLLTENKIDELIVKLLKERFNIDCSVSFKDGKPDKKNEKKNTFAEAFYGGEVNDFPVESYVPLSSVAEVKPQKRMGRLSSKVVEITEEPVSIKDNLIEGETVVFWGKVIGTEIRETKKGKYIVKAQIYDGSYSTTLKFFTSPEEYDDSYKALIEGKEKYVVAKGVVQDDIFDKELVVMVKEICAGEAPEKTRADNAEKKRVELHLHTNMSDMDGVSSVTSYLNRAKEWGHRAMAVTDHGVVQAFPEAMSAEKSTGVKVLYGCEAYLIDDLGTICENPKGQKLNDECVVFDLETTGLKKETDKIIEIGAVKVKDGEVVDKFSAFINPGIKLSDKIVKLTGITDDMLKDASPEEEVVPEFLSFCGDAVLIGHNVGFDIGFIRRFATSVGTEVNNTVVDTLGLARTLYGDLKNHKLDTVCDHLGVSLLNHHRAVDDAKATADIFLLMAKELEEKGIKDVNEINVFGSCNIDKNNIKQYYHAIILVKEQKGIRNLYELISDAHLKYFKRKPRIPKSEFIRLREGLIIGSACEAGELYSAIYENAPEQKIKELVDFYDYLEIQPLGNNKFMINNPSKRGKTVDSEERLIEINKKIVALGEQYNKPVCATCDCHFLDPEDEYFRRIIMAGSGFDDADDQAPLYFRTTEEMLDEFEYLGKEKAYEVVVENTNLIADMIGDVLPIPNETFPPHIDGAEEQLRDIAYNRAHEIYGDPLPKIVEDRLETELSSIISNGYAVLYIIAQRLVQDSNEHGYMVGSRGSVGSSFAATMAGITEVNPLEPHYICPNCQYSDFDSDIVKEKAGTSGFDLPDRKCPNCGTELIKEGQAIPFQTFLGFNGDKEPDIDLNFSGEYQANAHKYTEKLFGEGFVFKAGTIGTLADKTAYGYVKKHADERGLNLNSAEINRLVQGCVGIKKTTGQHPGGLMVVPSDNSIYNFCPVQHPANKVNSDVIITHFDYHSISGRLLKLDELGHDVPTIMHMYKEMTGVDPITIPMGDKKVMSLFTSPDALGVTREDIGVETGSLGLPEFGTAGARRMLTETQPTTFSELVRLSGLAHGTDVWAGNAQELIKNGVATLKEVIATRDDIMTYLISMGLPDTESFNIMEKVRKGKGLTPEWEALMREHNVPEWYIDSCKKIKYMFPKGHAAAYVTSAVRIGWFKIYYPYAFYAACFSMKLAFFNYSTCCFGRERVLKRKKELEAMGKDATANDKNELTTLELVNEMYARGLKFKKIDLYESDAVKFIQTDEGLMPPFATIPKLGETAAKSIVEARKDGRFETIDDFIDRTAVGKALVDLLKENGILEGIPETRQVSFFELA